GDAQDLTHAQRRVRRDPLVLLEELDQEAAAEVDREERGNQKAARAALLPRLLVDEVQAAEHGQAEDDLVDLARMAERRIRAVEAGKAKAPGAVGQLARDLGVHEVAEADERRAERGGEGEAVGALEERDAAPLAEQIHREDEPDHGSVAREPAGPNLEDPRRIAQGLVEIVEDDVAEARTDEHAEHAVHDEVVRVVGGTARTRDLPLQERMAPEEHEDEEQAV